MRIFWTNYHKMTKISPLDTFSKKIIIDNRTAKYYNYVEHKKY